jgi:tripartite-type tricarboxylate transporter receptor subunit TctC
VPGYKVVSWYGLFVPAKTPVSIVPKINAGTVALLKEPAVKARLEPLGVAGAGSTPAALAARAHADAQLRGPVIKAANLRGE